jgi:hypothetical protein
MKAVVEAKRKAFISPSSSVISYNSTKKVKELKDALRVKKILRNLTLRHRRNIERSGNIISDDCSRWWA